MSTNEYARYITPGKSPKIDKLVTALEGYNDKAEKAIYRGDYDNAAKYLGLVNLYHWKLGKAVHEDIMGRR